MQLTDSIQYVKGVGPKKTAELKRLGLRTVYDLLTYFPRTYEDQSVLTKISELQAGETVTVAGTIMNVSERQGGRRGMTILMALIGDGTGMLQVTWFNQKYLKNKLKVGKKVFVTGKAAYAYGGRGQFAMSQLHSFEILDEEAEPESRTGIVPVYPATEKLNQKFFRKVIAGLFAEELAIHDLIPPRVMKAYGLLTRQQALRDMHFPADFSVLQAARKHLAFEELYLIQCGLLLLKRQARENSKGIRHLLSSELVAKVQAALPFRLTDDQARTWQEIQRDMESPLPMRRLVQGDVGSGKTVIAMLALVKTVENGYQGALMAPTEILASQHYEGFLWQLEPLGIRIGFLSGRLTKKKREEMYARIAAQEVDIVIGTHALIQEGVDFAKLGLVVTDEQHRFGIAQRAELEKKGHLMPDVLVMTATPIPRTMTLTVYGDLDVSLIQQLPPGRQPIRTFVRKPDRRDLIYDYVHQQLAAGRQAYVVCPLIEMNEESDLPSAEEVYDELCYGIFRDMPCGLVHGRMKAAEKEQVMQDFYEDKIKLLVSTTVIEVGVNVPNASIMVVEHAERFGLAQLHQLRGRIGRGQYKSYCILVSEMKTENARERLKIMAETSDGFKLAEEDLRLRGPGQFFGSMQHGLPDLKVADVLGDMDILLQARQAAQETVASREERQDILPILALQYKEQFENITDI
ncbi:putative ATP-dependent DNA helicase RecG [Selenomonas ruminantium subsp. lactilytica TAM6421]|uniref:ATP-dependent DNA helicase RecG n=1 Tax=Selenomonas ruminantium subsp. lactilytica (strain NBRC 103574 / TAM6421) TaxID=927704 RepID=I0GQ17_SELRL|nr:ATP-dependent DNA helicase RecG [Selenomonas ruminantium]BAL82854.1 putative ATP-dependent DNA helicase RecG [Selenomonas ruminantium subsp. lactilytica TAM6421]